jgi:phosphate transport system substrate-binding protein
MKNIFYIPIPKQAYYAIIFLFLWANMACDKNIKNTAITGSETIYADSSTIEIVESLRDIYESIYTQANLNITYTNRYNALQKLVNDSVRVVILNEPLDTSLVSYFKNQKLSPRSINLLEDAIVLACNRLYPDSVILISELKNMLVKDSEKGQNIVALKSSAGMLEVISKKLGLNNLKLKVKLLDSPDEISKHLQAQPTDIALLALSWIGNPYHESVKKQYESLKILCTYADSTGAVCPSQETLMDKKYILTQNVFLNMKGNFEGVGSGFATFCLSERGQMIVLKAGLNPQITPSRSVELK